MKNFSRRQEDDNDDFIYMDSIEYNNNITNTVREAMTNAINN